MQIGFESSYHREFLIATQTACLSLKVVSIYIQVKEINWLQWLEEWVPFFYVHGKWTWVTVAKSVRKRCVIEFLCGVVCVVIFPFWHISAGVGAFVTQGGHIFWGIKFPEISLIFPWLNMHKISMFYYRNVGLVKGRIGFSMFCIIFADKRYTI